MLVILCVSLCVCVCVCVCERERERERERKLNVFQTVIEHRLNPNPAYKTHRQLKRVVSKIDIDLLVHV